VERGHKRSQKGKAGKGDTVRRSVVLRGELQQIKVTSEDGECKLIRRGVVDDLSRHRGRKYRLLEGGSNFRPEEEEVYEERRGQNRASYSSTDPAEEIMGELEPSWRESGPARCRISSREFQSKVLDHVTKPEKGTQSYTYTHRYSRWKKEEKKKSASQARKGLSQRIIIRASERQKKYYPQRPGDISAEKASFLLQYTAALAS